MQANNLNLDYRLDSKTLFNVSYFYTQLEDAITTMKYAVTDGYVPNIGTIPGITTESRQSNADKAVMKGFEIGLNKQLSKNWTSFINYTYTDARITESKNPAAVIGRQMDDIPKCMLNVGFDYKSQKWLGSISGRRISDTKEDGVKTGQYGSYDPVFLVDMKISYLPDKHSTVSLSIDNLFNRRYWSYYLAPTRSAFLEYSYKF
ncbi:MAG TPA: TonB-dependent receptor [Methylomusa anaerophila]|uniref:Vitamin B12 transporter BtuB n=1 Tax=Methylomusa anaerophila TaxID=1930071 RepID=A0A348AEA8_9FIRM|nr:TonB-dependent receptor [Methylomusa anaerophila]BBB89406.1 vitamin B12 transporter BtuB [Methylomusa anaerophila]HML90483.1 TonB-dependent receptor [Methylomusa anaerophila]